MIEVIDADKGYKIVIRDKTKLKRIINKAYKVRAKPLRQFRKQCKRLFNDAIKLELDRLKES